MCDDDDEISDMDKCGCYMEGDEYYDGDCLYYNFNNSKNKNINSDNEDACAAFGQLIFVGEEKAFDDVNLSMIGLKNVKILIDKDWYCFYLANIERIGDILHYAQCIDSLVCETKYRSCHAMLSRILHKYIGVNTDLSSKNLIWSKVQCIRASVAYSHESGSIEEIIQL